MPVVTLSQAKQHLRIDGTDEDDDIQLRLEAAEDAVARHLDRPLPWTDAEGQAVPVPASVKLGILMLVGTLYAHRESAMAGLAVTDHPALVQLLSSYRRRCWS